MSIQNPTLPTQVDPRGIDAALVDLQQFLDVKLGSWLTNGMGRAYRLIKVRSNQSTVFLPEVYLGGDKYKYFAATPDNDKTGQNIFIVGDETDPNQRLGQYGRIEYPLSIIFNANLEKIDAALLLTENFTEHLIEDVRNALKRDLLGKAYRITINNVVRGFEDVYAEFDVQNDRGVSYLPMTHFRFNCNISVKEECATTPFDACTSLLGNITIDEKLNCILPTYDFADTDTQDALMIAQVTDLTDWLCVVDNGAKYKFNYSTRLVNNDYLGFCMQVRRGSDSATLDIPFVGGVLDEAAIVTFCGASIGYVTKWYIQDSSGNDLIQASTNEQPVIYDGAIIYKESGFPCIRFLNTGVSPAKYFDFTYSVGCDLTNDVPLITGIKYTVSAASGNYWLGGVGISGGNAGVGGFNSASPNGVFAADGMGNLIAELGATTKNDFKLSSVDATIIKTNGVDVGAYARQDDMNGAFLLTRVGTAPQTEVNLAVDGALCEISLISLLCLANPAVARQEVEDEIVTYYSL